MNREKLIYSIGTFIILLILGGLSFFFYKKSPAPDRTTNQQESDSFCKKVFGYDNAEPYSLTRKSTVAELTLDGVLNEFARLGIEINRSLLPKTLFNQYALVRDGKEVKFNFKDNVEAFAVGNTQGFDATNQILDGNMPSLRNGLISREVIAGEDLSTQYCIKLKNRNALDVSLSWPGVVNVNAALRLLDIPSILVIPENYEDGSGAKIALKALESMKLDSIGESFLTSSLDSDPILESVVVKVDDEKSLVWVQKDDLRPGLNQLIVTIGENLYTFDIEN